MLHLLHINVIGLAILAFGFGAAFAVGWLGGFDDEGRLMMIAGPLISLLDFTYRVTRDDCHLLRPSSGGMLFYIPLWLVGALWLALGTYYVVAG